MYIQLVSIHGLVRGHSIEMGRDADTGGQVRYALELTKMLSSFDEVRRVDLFTRQIRDKRVSSDYEKGIEKLGPKCRIVRLPCGGGKYIRKERLWPFLEEFVDAMISFTRREGVIPDIVHGHYADGGYIAKEVGSAFGVPFVFTAHSLGRMKQAYLVEQGRTEESLNREFNIDYRIEQEEVCLATAELVIASTTHERDNQYGCYNNGKLPDFEVIPPGLDLDRFFPYYEYDISGSSVAEFCKQARVRMTDELARFHFQMDKPLILALCRPDRRKNIAGLIRAYGKDRELQALANLAIFAGLRKDITEMEESQRSVLTEMLVAMDDYDLYGKMAIPKYHRSDTDVPELYRIAASSRGVFANTCFVETFGLTLIEASAVGLPFVATEKGGPPDIVANCRSGLLVNVENEKEVASALKKMLTERAFWEECSANGINRVRKHYTWEAHCRKYLKAVKSLWEKRTEAAVVSDRDEFAIGRRMAELDSLLITDIDNTLVGDDRALEQLLEVLEEHRDHLGFGVASGRSFDLVVRVLAENGIDDIDVIISSVGTEIYYGKDHEPDKGWGSHLRAKWRPERIQEALSQLDFLYLQEREGSQREFKLSYDLDEQVPVDEALPQIHEAISKVRAPYTLIFSHGVYLDILPHRASKGKAIRYIGAKWSVPFNRIATAGDSGNDRDMLLGQTAGIVVANHDEELESLRESSSRVYFAETSYAGGILEGLEHYGFLTRSGESGRQGRQ